MRESENRLGQLFENGEVWVASEGPCGSAHHKSENLALPEQAPMSKKYTVWKHFVSRYNYHYSAKNPLICRGFFQCG